MIGSSWLKTLLRKTPIYPSLRAAWGAVRPKSHGEKLAICDAQSTTAILRRVLTSDANGVDIGAHVGDFLTELVRIAPGGKHVAVEPIPPMADRLRAAFPQVAVHAAALSDSPGTTTFQWVRSNPAFSGLVRRDDLSTSEHIEPIKVRVECLDDLIPAGARVDLIKIDVEGGEVNVLRGASRVLRENRPWVIFEHGSACRVYGYTTSDIVGEFATHRMAIWILTDWLAGKSPMTFDGLAAAIATGQYNFLAGPAPEAT
jgi:FkbM family methyltransferase